MDTGPSVGTATVFLDRLTFPILGSPPPQCDFLALDGQSDPFPLVAPRQIKDHHVWFLRKRVQVSDGPILIRVYTQDGKPLGSSKVRFSSLQGRHMAKFPIKVGLSPDTISTDGTQTNNFQLEFLSKMTAQTKKKVYIIRHAESRWNEAQCNNWWDKALSEIDHGVSTTGVEQSLALREALSKVVPNNSLIALVSPHRRTMQTALIATRTLRIHLDPRMREFTSGPDGHANTVGQQIFNRAEEELHKMGVKKISNAIIDDSAVQESWWSHRFETTKKVDMRIKDFLRDLQYLPEEQIIIVGHSRWFKRMFNIMYGKSLRRSSGNTHDAGLTNSTRTSAASKSGVTTNLPSVGAAGNAPIDGDVMDYTKRITQPQPPTMDLMNMDTDLLGLNSPMAPQPPARTKQQANSNDLMNLDFLNAGLMLHPPMPTNSSNAAPNALPIPGGSARKKGGQMDLLSGNDDDDDDGDDDDDDGIAGDDAEDSESDGASDLKQYARQNAAAVEDPKCKMQREIQRALRHCRLPNCGCVAVDFVWDDTILPQIDNAKIIYGEIEAPPDSQGRKKKIDKDACVIS
eukprot:GEMP01010770.1.p1 GENE.GEMP01010770.1~~GEMP01010770.1.p1  ORF type:complete len:572 (+),score=116.17 GEMP01010770.1:398-2113(+)